MRVDLFARRERFRSADLGVIGCSVVAGLLAGVISAWSPLAGLAMLAATIVAAMVVVGAAIAWPRFGIVTLMVAVAINRYSMPVGGMSVRPEQVVSLVLVVMLGIRALVIRKWPLRIDLAALLLIMFVALNAIASLLNAPDVGESFKGVVLLSLTTVPPYLLLLALIDSPSQVRFALGVWFWIAAAEGALGAAAMALAGLGLDLGVQTVYTGGYSAYGTLWESNIYGSYLAAAAAALFALSLTHKAARFRSARTVAFGLVLVGVIVSLSRGPWLALAATLLWLSLPRLPQLLKKVVPWCLAVVGCCLVVVFLAPTDGLPDEIGQYLEIRLETLNPSRIADDGTAMGRLNAFSLVLQDSRHHPFVGWGTNVFGQRFGATAVSQDGWIGNIFLHAFYDTGLLGLLIVLTLIGWLAWSAFRAYRQTTDQELRSYILALGSACLVMLLAFQATDGMWLAFTWVNVGLLSATARYARQSRRSQDEAAFNRSGLALANKSVEKRLA